MIGIRIVDGLKLELQGVSIRFELANPMFRMDTIISAYSFPFAFPDTPHNRKALGYLDKFQNRQASFTHDVEILLDDDIWLKGQLLVKYKSGKFQGTFKQKHTLFATLERKLNSYDWGTLDASTPSDLLDDLRERALQTWPTKDFTFVTWVNDNLLNNKDDLTYDVSSPWVNRWPASYNGYINWYVEYESLSVIDHFYVVLSTWEEHDYGISPCFYVKHVLDSVFQNSGLSINSSALFDDEMANLIIQTDRVMVFGVELPSGSPTPTITFPQSSYDLKEYIPAITVNKLVKALRKGFNTPLFFNFRNNEAEMIPVKNILESFEVDDLTALSAIDYELEEQIYTIGLQYEYSDDAALNRGTYTTLIFPGAQQLAANQTIIDPVADRGSLPSAASTALGTICFVIDENMFFRVEQQANPFGLSWFPYSINIIGYPEDPEVTDSLNLEFDTLQMYPGNLPDTVVDKWAIDGFSTDTRYIRIPITSAVTPTGIYDIPAKDTEYLRFLFWRGFVQVLDDPTSPGTNSHYTAGRRYLYGSSDNLNPDGTDGYNYALTMYGDKGLWNIWWKPWQDYLSAHPKVLTRNIYMDKTRLLNWDFKKKIRMDDALGFCRKLSVVLSAGAQKLTAKIEIQ